MIHLVKLKQDVVLEPLVSRWHAWSHLISPGTSSLNFAFRLVQQMESFLDNPELHILACQNPDLKGGPFVDLPVTATSAIQALVDETKIKASEQIEFGKSLKECYRQILKHTDGTSLEHLYNSLPEPLKGYVEFSYTVGGFPDLKLNEALLYKGKAYNPDTQSGLLYRIHGDARPFAFSTPRLSHEDAIDIPHPFDHHQYDVISELRTNPRDFDEVVQELGFTGENLELFKTFVEPASPTEPKHKPSTALPQWRYFGHACVLVEASDGTSVLLDPVLAYQGDSGDGRLTINDLPEKIDYIVLTHNHADHVAIETLLALRWKTGTIVIPPSGGGLADPSLKMMLKAIGFKRVIELQTLESVGTNEISITALPFLGEHGDLDIRSKAAWLIETNHKKLLFAADSNNLDPSLYDHIERIVGSIDYLFIGMECQGAPLSWVYGPLLPVTLERKKDQSRRLNGSDCDRALRVVSSLKSKHIYIYAMGMEPWIQYITSIDPSEDTAPMVNSKAFIEACITKDLSAERLYIQACEPI
jgi:L-ascorbate metabolism protein UlaG (beta-lactamase superfamily)